VSKPYIRDLIFRSSDAAALWCAAVGSASTRSGTFVDRSLDWVTTDMSLKDIRQVSRLNGEGPRNILICRDEQTGEPLTRLPGSGSNGESLRVNHAANPLNEKEAT
jgi:hypothetical protein